METTIVFVPIKRDTIRKNPDAGRTSFPLSMPAEVTLKFKGEELPDYMPKNKAYGQEYNFIDRVSIWRIRGILETELYNQLRNDPRFVEIEMRQDVQYIETKRPAPDYLFSYEDPTFYYEGLGEIKVSDLEEDYDYDLYRLYYKPTGEEVDVDLQYEKIEDVLKDIAN